MHPWLKESQERIIKKQEKKIRHRVFWPPFILLSATVAFSLYDSNYFSSILNIANDWLLAKFGWLYSICGLAMVFLCIFVYFSPFGNTKIGGDDAKPLLPRWNWFTIVLCTTVAIGVIFWAAAEPIYHLTNPPKYFNIKPGSPQAVVFSLSTMYLHWTFTPYALYCIPALMFAVSYYNLKRPFSLGSLLSPLFGEKLNTKWGWLLDAVCLFTLVAGMSASLGTGILTLAGGLDHLFGIERTSFVLGLLVLLVVGTFVVSASSGLMKGIRILSDLNIKFFMGLLLFIMITGPTAYFFNLGTESIGDYLTNFFQKSLFTGTASGEKWPIMWTTFYWANWLAWAPVTSLFLGRLSYGYRVKDFMMMNFFIPALFGILWITIFSGTALFMETNGMGLSAALQTRGPESVAYSILANLPISEFIVPIFLFISFISFVTAADSNTSAMSGISSSGISPESPEASTFIKILWGGIIGAISWFFVSSDGINGIKMLSNLGGFPALIIELLVAVTLVKVISKYKKKSN